MLPKVHGEFRVGTDPEIKFSQGGVAYTRFRAVASKQKKQDDNTWVDDKDIWVNVTSFKKLAENVAESVAKGSLVTISGEISVSEYTTDGGEKRTSVDLVADHIGLSMARDSYVGTTQRASSSGSSQQASAPASEDPWGSAPAGKEPPF